MRVKISTSILYLLTLGNIIGVLFGFTYWYGKQLLANAWYLWPLIAVSPLYALFFLIALAMLRKKKDASFFYYLTAVGLIKYGLWTVLFWSTAKDTGLPFLMIIWLVGSHLVMALEALFVFAHIRPKATHMVSILVWFLLNDYVQYFRGLLTNKIVISNFTFDMVVALVLTVIVPVLVFFVAKAGKINVEW